MADPRNTYSPHWFTTFLDTVRPEQTAAEVEFLTRLLPTPAFARVLDICCGAGRHAIPLAARGYRVTGVDASPHALRAAAERAAALAITDGTAAERALVFLEADVRRLPAAGGEYDAATVMWASFGYFDAPANAHVLAQLATRLRPAGRLVLDIYNRDFFVGRDGTRVHERGGARVAETKVLLGDRLAVRLDYGPDRPADRMEWQLFTPASITTLAATHGLSTVLACARFDERLEPSAEEPRMQLVFEKLPSQSSSSPRH